jgi:glycosyltransferase involved in cell wall biosynthesis
MLYSVIIPCLNEGHVLAQTLRNLKNAAGERNDVEIFLIDNGSTDDSVDIANAHKLTVVSRVDGGISALRNQGARLSSGKQLVFLDADMQVPQDWFVILDRYSALNTVDAVGFVDSVPDHAPWFARIWGQRTKARRAQMQRVDALPGRNLMVSRLWFERVNGFNERLVTGEDKDFVMRLSRNGANVFSVPGVNIVHLGYERTFREWCQKEYWRQHSHISLMQHQGISLRLLRFPLIAVLHWPLGLLTLFYMVHANQSSVCFALLWFAPSTVLSLKHAASRWPPVRLAQFTTLYWLRFHIAGFSVIKEAFEIQQWKQKPWN